jgi:hypothetical protein
VSASVYFGSQGQVTQLLTVIVGHIVTERNMSLLFGNELDTDHYAVLAVEKERERLSIFDEVYFY